MNCTANGKKLCEGGFQVWFVAHPDGKAYRDPATGEETTGKRYSVPCPICNVVAYQAWESSKIKRPDGTFVPNPGIAIPNAAPKKQAKAANQARLFEHAQDAF